MNLASKPPPTKLDDDSDEEMRDLITSAADGEPDPNTANPNLANIEEFQLNGVRGVAFAAYQNEEITDYYIWNDKEGLNKKQED